MTVLRIHRYILREIITPTALSLVIFTFVLLMGKIPTLAELVINKGVPAAQIVQLFGYLLPTFFSITFPLSFLLGILLAFGRLSADSEFIALKASGVSLYSLVKPVLLLAFFFSLITICITTTIEPASKAAFKSKLFEIASSSASINIKPGVFNDKFAGIVLYARGVDEIHNTMADVFISDERNGETPATITAQRGQLISNQGQYSLTLRLSDGNIHRHPRSDKQATYQTISFTNYDINLDIGAQLSKRQLRRSRSELSWGELNDKIEQTNAGRKKFEMEAEKHQRIVIAFAPLVLVLVGIPLGLQSQRSGKGAGFALGLMVFMIYYLILKFALNIAVEGFLPAALTMWLPNLIFLLGGIWFIHRTATEKPLQVLDLPRKFIKRLLSNRNKDRKKL